MSGFIVDVHLENPGAFGHKSAGVAAVEQGKLPTQLHKPNTYFIPRNSFAADPGPGAPAEISAPGKPAEPVPSVPESGR